MIAGLSPALYHGEVTRAYGCNNCGDRTENDDCICDKCIPCPCIFCGVHCNETCEGEDIVEHLTKQVINDGLDFAGVMIFLAMCGVAMGVWI